MPDETGTTPATTAAGRSSATQGQAGDKQEPPTAPGKPAQGGGDRTAGSPARAAGQQPASAADGANEGAFDNPADATPESP